MGWIESFKICMFKKIFKFSGRASRQEFWKFIAIGMLISFILNTSSNFLNFFVFLETISIKSIWLEILEWTSSIYGIIFTIGFTSATCRRLHDINKSAWYLVAFYFIPLILMGIMVPASVFFPSMMRTLIPIYMLIFLGLMIYEICLLAKKGDPETNKYGEPPISNKTNETRNKKEIIETENN